MGSMIKLPALQAFQAAAAYELVGLSGVMSEKDVDVLYPGTERQAYRLKWKTADDEHEVYLGLNNFMTADIGEDGTIAIADDQGTPMALKLYSAACPAPISREVAHRSPAVRIYVDLESQSMLIGDDYKVSNEIRDFVKRFGTISEVRFNLDKDFEIPDVSTPEYRSKILAENSIPEACNRFSFSISRNYNRNTAVMECHFTKEYQVEFLRLFTQSFCGQLGTMADTEDFNFERAVNGLLNMVDSIKDSFGDDIPF